MAALRRRVAEDPYESAFGNRVEPLWNALMPSWLQNAEATTSSSPSDPRQLERERNRSQLLRDAAASVARDTASLQRGRSERRSISTAPQINASAKDNAPGAQISTYSYAAAKSTSWDSWTNKARRAEWDSDSGETRVFEYDPIANRMVDVLAQKKGKEGGVPQANATSATELSPAEAAEKQQVDTLADAQNVDTFGSLAETVNKDKQSPPEPAISAEFEQNLHLYNIHGQPAPKGEIGTSTIKRRISPSPSGRRRSPKPPTLKDNYNPLDTLLDTFGAEVNAKNAASGTKSPKKTDWEEAVDDVALQRELEKLRLADDHATSTTSSSASVAAIPKVAALQARRAAAEVRKASDEAALEAAKRAARDARFLQQDDFCSNTTGTASVGAPASAEEEYAESIAAQERIKCLEDAARRSSMELEKARMEVGSVLLKQREMGHKLKSRLAARAQSPGAGAASGGQGSSGSSAAGGASGNGGDGDGSGKRGLIEGLFDKLPTINTARSEAPQSQQNKSASELLSQISRLQKQYTDQYGHQITEPSPALPHVYTKPPAYRAPVRSSHRSSQASHTDLDRQLGSSLADFDSRSSGTPGRVSGRQRFDPAETEARMARDETAATDKYYTTPAETIRQDEALDEFERNSKRYPSANDRFNPQEMVDHLVQEEQAAHQAFSEAHTNEERRRLDEELRRFSTARASGKHYSPEAQGGKFNPRDTAARMAREERAAHEEYSSAYQSPALPDDDRLAHLVGKFPKRTADAAAAQRAWEEENRVDHTDPESHSRNQIEGELSRFGGNAQRRFDPRQTAEEIYRETGAPAAPQQAHERLPDDERLNGLLGKFPSRTSDSAAAQRAWEAEQYGAPLNEDVRAHQRLEEQLTRHSSRPTSAFGPDALSKEIVQEQSTPTQNQDYHLPDDARLGNLVGQYPSGSSAEARFHAENARTPATSESRDRDYLSSELARHKQSSSAFDPSTTAAHIVRDDPSYYEKHQDQHSSFLPAEDESRFTRRFTAEHPSSFVTPDQPDASANDSEHHPAAALNDYECSPDAARAAAQRETLPPRYTILTYNAARHRVEVSETFNSFIGAEDELSEQDLPDLSRLENPDLFAEQMERLQGEQGLDVVAVGRDWVALSTPTSDASSSENYAKTDDRSTAASAALSSIKSFFGGRTVSFSDLRHPSSTPSPSGISTSPPPPPPSRDPTRTRRAKNGSNDESHMFASAAAAVPSPPGPRLPDQESKFSCTSSFADLRSRSPRSDQRRTQAYDRSSCSSEQHHPHSERSENNGNNELPHPSEKSEAKFQLHRHFYPRSSRREDVLSREERRAHRAARNDFRRSRKRRFRAALIWSGSVGVAAVGVAYGVGVVAENW
jgi:hypothetical protein